MIHEGWRLKLGNETIKMKNQIWYTKQGKLSTTHETWKWNNKNITCNMKH